MVFNQKERKHHDKTYQDKNYKDKKQILEYFHKDQWDQIINYAVQNKDIDMNQDLVNGNNIFHLACVKEKADFMKKIIDLAKVNKINLNINKPNGDGELGLHMYYSYGGTDPSFLDSPDICYLNSENKTLVSTILDKIELLERFIDNIIRNKCTENLEMSAEQDRYYVLYEISKRVHENIKINTSLAKRYMELLRKLYLVLESKTLAFIAIYIDSIDIIRLLFTLDFNFEIYNTQAKITPLIMAVRLRRLQIVEELLTYVKITKSSRHAYDMIHSSGQQYNDRAILSAIENKDTTMIRLLIEHLKPYIEDYKNSHNAKLLFDQTDSFHNTYLHRLLDTKEPHSIPKDIIKFFIDHTDLNQANYAGNTSAHIIFQTGVWKTIRKSLKNREIDLLKLDEVGNNSYSFILESDKETFMEFIQDIKVPIDVDSHDQVKKIYDIKDMMDTERKYDKSQNFGLFNPNMIHYLLYLRYIENKHSNMYVPVTPYDEEMREKEMFFLDLTSYSTCKKQAILNKNVHSYMSAFYSYLPHNIYWLDKDQYYVHPKLIDILKEHDKNTSAKKERYIMLKITIVINTDLLHANCLLYDRKNKEAWRFEPYGITDMSGGVDMDNQVKAILEQAYGKITYYDPDSYLTGLNFQLVDGEDDEKNHNLGDPGGYCLAWSMWFLDVVLSHPEDNIKELLTNYLQRDKINNIINKEESKSLEVNKINRTNKKANKVSSNNYYLDFIRRYAHKLDTEKNKILLTSGIQKYHVYNMYPKEEVFEQIIKLFRVK